MRTSILKTLIVLGFIAGVLLPGYYLFQLGSSFLEGATATGRLSISGGIQAIATGWAEVGIAAAIALIAFSAAGLGAIWTGLRTKK